MKVLINTSLLLLTMVFAGSCATFGTVSKSYNYSKQEIWSAMTAVIDKNYGGISKILPNPPTMISNLTIKDKQFGIDKTAYQVHASLSGFSRPYVADVEVRSFANGEEGSSYDADREKAQEIIDQIGVLLEHRRYNSSIQDQYLPY